MGPNTSMCEVLSVWTDPSPSNLSAFLVCFPSELYMFCPYVVLFSIPSYSVDLLHISVDLKICEMQ